MNEHMLKVELTEDNKMVVLGIENISVTLEDSTINWLINELLEKQHAKMNRNGWILCA